MDNKYNLKKSIAFVLFALPLCMRAQFSPFISTGKTWHVMQYSDAQQMHNDYSKGPINEYDLSFMQNSDTIINGQSFHKLICHHSEDNGTGSIAAILRESQGKVYKWNGTAESLIYDFTVKEGEEIEIADTQGVHKCKVKEVGTIYSNGMPLKTITLATTFSDPLTEEQETAESEITWIEGFGSSNGPLCSFTNPYEAGQSLLLSPYATIGDEQYIPLSFQLPLFHGQQLVLGKEITSDIPAEAWGHNDLSYEFVDDNTLRMYGTMWTTCSPNQYIYMFIENNNNIGEYQVSIRVEELAPHADNMGAYEIDMCFRNFFPEGRYFFPGMKDTLTIPHTSDGIWAHAINNATSNSIYDLSGRRLLETPRKGIYIKNGKLLFLSDK